MIFRIFKIFVLLFFINLQATKGIDYTDLIKNAGNTSQYPNSSVLVIFDSTSVEVEETGLSHFRIHVLYKALTGKGGFELSIIKYPYEPMSMYMEVRAVKIYRNNGKIENLERSHIYDYPAPGTVILWGAREQMIAVGRLEKDEAVEIEIYKKGYTYALLEEDEDKYIPPMRGHYYDIVPFWVNWQTKEKVYQTIIPAGKHLQYSFYNGEVLPKVRYLNGKICYSFTKLNIAPFTREPNMVDLFDVAPKLILTTAPDWQSKSRWFYQVNEEFGSFEWTPEIKSKTDEILKGAKDEWDSVARLTHWVADHIRYFGLNMGCGEGYTLHKAEMTFTDRCGVCKDKAGMLVTMLRAAGFEAYAAMTMAGSKIENIPADHFNHSVTAVRMSDGQLHMLDPTWVPFIRELWSSREQQQNYIVGTKNGESLMEIPISKPENHYYNLKIQSTLLENGELYGNIMLEAEGQSDATFRSALTRISMDTWDQTIIAELLTIFPEMKIEALKFSNPYDYSTPFQIDISFRIYNFATIVQGNYILTPVSAHKIFKNFNSHYRINTSAETKKYAFRDNCSKLIVIEEKIALPFAMNTISMPPSQNIIGQAADFQAAYSIENQILLFNEKLTLKKRIYESNEWQDIRQVILLQEKFEKEGVVLSPKK